MPTVYSASSSQWPLLQSKTEQKFKSGLFNVSAEFIRPVGNIELPTSIETSIGPVDVWPDPTITTGTDGFERINATGYGVWDYNISEVTFGYEITTLTGKATSLDRCTTNNYYQTENGVPVLKYGCGNFGCGDFLPDSARYVTGGERLVILQTAHVKKIGDQTPANPGLKYYDGGMRQITGGIVPFLWAGLPSAPAGESALYYLQLGLPSFYKAQEYEGFFGPTSAFVPVISSLKKNYYGSIIETEVIYSLRGPSEIDFGMWYEPLPVCLEPTLPETAP